MFVTLLIADEMGINLNISTVKLINFLCRHSMEMYTAVKMNELQPCNIMDESQEHSVVG